VRVIYQHDHVLTEVRVVPAADLDQLRQRRVVSAHAEDAIRDHQRPLPLALHGAERALQVGHVVVLVDGFLRRPRQRIR
jgi:hypothetical protein